jgi:predicted outer membrane repeat protein
VTGPTLVLNDLTVQNGRFDNGMYASGGCFDLPDWFVEWPPILALNRVVVRGCAAHFGGAIAASGVGGSHQAITVTDTTIQQNSAVTRGGGIYAGVGVLLAVTRSTISGNLADAGAGLFAQGELTLANTTISGNTSSSAAGAIEQDAGTLALTNVTIAANSSGTLGAVHVSGGTARVRNSIVANNAGVAPANCSAATVVTDLGNNLEFAGTTCGFSLPSDRRADPLLGPLAANGAATMTHALRAGSPAIDAGDEGACAAAPVSGVDQRGRSRSRGAHCDMGAYEAPVPFTDDPLVAGTTVVRGVHVTELRARIDALRLRAGLSPYSWTDLSRFGGLVAAEHIQEMRAALIEAYPAEQSPLVFTDQPLVPGHTAIRAVHLAELRAAVSAIE